MKHKNGQKVTIYVPLHIYYCKLLIYLIVTKSLKGFSV